MMPFAESLQQRKKKVSGTHLTKFESSSGLQNQNNLQSEIEAGPEGATLVKISALKLLNLMENDKQLAECVDIVLVNGLQKKLRLLMDNDNEASDEL